MLSVRNLCKRYGGGRPDGSAAVESFTHDFSPNAVTTILGPSGGGKTTLLHLIAGLLRPDCGTILLDDEDVTDLPPHRRGVGVVFQSYALFPHLSVRGNVKFGLKFTSLSRRDRRRRAGEMLDRLRISHLADRGINQVSGGEQQRVALARALATRPRVLQLDEPLSALDAPLRERLRDELVELLQDGGVTTLYVTHDRGEALGLGESLVVMNAGRIEQSGPPAEVYAMPANRFVAGFVCGANVVEAECVEAPAGRVLRLPFVMLPAPPQISTGPCGAVLRPEDFEPADPHEPGHFHGTIESARFLGDRVRLSVRPDGPAGDPLRVDLPAIGDPRPGGRVGLRIRRELTAVVSPRIPNTARPTPESRNGPGLTPRRDGVQSAAR